MIRLITVSEGADIADDRIAEMLAPGDLVITGDIPLAARVVTNSAIEASYSRPVARIPRCCHHIDRLVRLRMSPNDPFRK